MATERFDIELKRLSESSNLRNIPSEDAPRGIDLSSNDYLGIADRTDWRDRFLAEASPSQLLLTSSASRLLATHQSVYADFEQSLASLYGGGRAALLFNSGYHANTGVISAIADKRTLILADRLVHASIIDGIKLSGARFSRFPHNDFQRLERLISEAATDVSIDTILVIVEGVYSMDGDEADILRLVDIKRRFPSVMLYVDEAHSFGVCGSDGLGLVKSAGVVEDADIVIGTLGKAAASSGAFAIVSPTVREYLVNRARSLIFSTALAPINVAWSRFVVERIPDMTAERSRLSTLASKLHSALSAFSRKGAAGTSAQMKAVTMNMPSHIQPLILGDAELTIQLSRRLAAEGVKALPIRVPTVPPGTERIRFSLSASITDTEMDHVCRTLKKLYNTVE